MNVDARLFGLILQALRRRLGDGLLSTEVVNHLRDLAAEAEAVYRQAIAESEKEKKSRPEEQSIPLNVRAACVRCTLAEWFAHGKAIVQCQPIERVELTRNWPYLTFEKLWGWSRLEDTRDRGSPSYLPSEVYDLLPEPDHIKPPVGLWTSEDRARAALSTALLRWAGSPGLSL